MTKNNTFTVGVCLAIVGICMFSAKAVLVKLAYRYEVSSTHLLLFRMLFSLPFYLVIAFIKKPLSTYDRSAKDYAWVVLMGFVGYYLASYFDFVGLQYIKAGLERIILFVYPTLVVLLSWMFLKKKATSSQLWAIALTYLGVCIAFWNEPKFSGEDTALGGFFVFLSALTYAAYLVGSGFLIPKFGVVVFTSYAMIVSCVCVFLHYFITDRGDITVYDEHVYLYGFLMAIFCTIIPSYLVSAAIQKLGASTFAVFGSLGPFSTIFLAFVFLDERLVWLQFLGAMVVILGVYFVGKAKKKTE